MHAPARAAVLVAVALAVTASTLAQAPTKEPTGSITGRVTIGGKPAPGVVVSLQPGQPGMAGPSPGAPAPKATTDEDGRFRLTGVAAGQFTVTPIAPAFVLPNNNQYGQYGQPGKSITMAEGEAVEGVDFALTRGGVIAGRVVDAEGRPIIGERVELNLLDERGQKRPVSTYMNGPSMSETDDRGFYRLYGLQAGRYLVSVGVAKERGMVRMGGSRNYYPQTFHPGVAEESLATVVEVKAGSEATNVDITLGRQVQGYDVSGRMVDEAGQPAAFATFGYGSVSNNGKSMGAFGFGLRTDTNGEFRIEGILPGSYAVFVASEGESEYYSDAVPFDVINQDITGLEVKLRRGGSISGLAMVEGATDPAALSAIQQLQLSAYTESQDLSPPRIGSSQIGPDGGFRITGLRPGKVRISLSTFRGPKGFSLLRVERDGVAQRDGVEVAPGERVTGVRLVFAYGTAVVRGQVQVVGGTLPEGTRLFISTRRVGDSTPQGRSGGQVDDRGRFFIEGLAAGDYEIMLNVIPPPPVPGGGPPARPSFPPVKQTVTVAGAGETPVILTIDLSQKEKEQ